MLPVDESSSLAFSRAVSKRRAHLTKRDWTSLEATIERSDSLFRHRYRKAPVGLISNVGLPIHCHINRYIGVFYNVAFYKGEPSVCRMRKSWPEQRFGNSSWQAGDVLLMVTTIMSLFLLYTFSSHFVWALVQQSLKNGFQAPCIPSYYSHQFNRDTGDIRARKVSYCYISVVSFFLKAERHDMGAMSSSTLADVVSSSRVPQVFPERSVRNAELFQGRRVPS